MIESLYFHLIIIILHCLFNIQTTFLQTVQLKGLSAQIFFSMDWRGVELLHWILVWQCRFGREDSDRFGGLPWVGGIQIRLNVDMCIRWGVGCGCVGAGRLGMWWFTGMDGHIVRVITEYVWVRCHWAWGAYVRFVDVDHGTGVVHWA